MTPNRILILGGTAESRELAARLSVRPNVDVVLSLAGRTREPARYPVPTRIGGFGGAAGLADYLGERKIDLLIDATHPFAMQMSRNAALAAAETGVAFFALSRPAWQRTDGDRWTDAGSVADAVGKLGSGGRRVFVALGRQELAPLSTAPHHSYLVRSVDPVDPPLPLPDVRYVQARGPFEFAAERDMLSGEGIEAILAKNSGGSATYAKIAAARELGIEVLLVRRPERYGVRTVETVLDAVDLAHQRLISA